ncbi:testis-expressed protein 2-like isoform X1 [Drosophila montana]|uniref:testis-expressed protein 2-like isoform X1 n=1 Tax=Drosophila montana TaxID=40370 RepID=UPI00313EE625
MDSLKLPKASSANSSASGSNSNLSGSASTSVVGSLATTPTSAVPATVSTTIKTPPGLSSSTPIAVRFNANQESLDDILHSFHHSTQQQQQQHSHSPSGGISGGGDASPTLMGIKNNGALGMMVNPCDSHSLSSSPSQQQQQQQQQQHQQQQQQQHLHQHQQQQQQAAALFGNEEATLRNNYLQGGGGGAGAGAVSGGFFNRKRSGSIEGVSPTSSGPTLISALSSSVTAAGDSTASVGTWKLIKGKVSQTIEEIKSSKHHASVIPVIVAESTTGTTVGWTNEGDSDTECITINTNVSEEQHLTIEKQHNSDSDPEIELLDTSSLGSGDISAAAALSIEGSRLRRGIAHIKSRVKAKQQAAAMSRKERESSVPNAPSSIRGGFLRRRNNNNAEANNEGASGSGQQGEQPKHIHQSSSAPEIPIASGKSKSGILLAAKDVEIESGVEMHEDMAPTTSSQAYADAQSGNVQFSDIETVRERSFFLDLPLSSASNLLEEPLARSLSADPLPFRNNLNASGFSLWSTLSAASSINWRAGAVSRPMLAVGSLVVLTVLPLPEFWRGVLATVMFIAGVNYCSHYISYLFENHVLGSHPERRPFQIPNYDGMPICEIPAVEEHKTIKSYSGWMNELESYDPATFSFAMTRAIYVRLDGTNLKISGTNARVPKRRMWNEKPIDRAKILFLDHRSYDLRDARVELLPTGLARKRFFNRKYPIQLIVKNACTGYFTPMEDAESTDGASRAATITPTLANETLKPIEFASTVMLADLRQLHNSISPDKEVRDITIPCGDEVRLLMFARCDREKEDWYRRFIAASKGCVHESELQVPMAHYVEDTDLQAVAAQQAINLTRGFPKARFKEPEEGSMSSLLNDETPGANTPDTLDEAIDEDPASDQQRDGYEGLIMNADVARNPAEYVKFMAVYQKACNQSQIPVCRNLNNKAQNSGANRRRSRRARRQEHELWKGINQSLFLGPSGSVVWANVLLGRCLFSCLHNPGLQIKIQEFMQKKLNSIKLPSFMEEVIITNIYLGKSPMLVHRISQPMLDERGIWLDADVTYEGLAHITVTTKLNLLRVRSKPKSSTANSESAGPSQDPNMEGRSAPDELQPDGSNSIFDSDAESTGGSSSDSEASQPGPPVENANNAEFFQNSPGNARRIFKIVDRIATSNLFQYATELPYVQRAMENMNANITLRVELKGLVARGTLNIPPPPSDRVWLCFRGPPRLWISTKPQVGDKSVDWSIVTNVIESKLCEAVNKFLVYPNMVDFSIPFLAKPNYDEEPPMS